MISLARKAIKANQQRKQAQTNQAPMELQETGSDATKQAPQRPQCRHMEAYESWPGKCVACASEKKAARIYRWKVILGLVAPFALQALDSTMYGKTRKLQNETDTLKQHRQCSSVDCVGLRGDLTAQLDRLGVQPHICSIHPFLGSNG